VLFIGTKEPRKNIAGLIEAYKKSNAYDMGYSLVIAGAPGWKCRLVRNMIQCTKGIVSYDYISEEEKRGMYEKASLFIFPSFYEGFGFPPLEAAVYGCPVIVSNRSSLPEIMGDAAYYVDPYNITDMATGISRMLTNASLRMKYAELGKKQVEKYTWEDMAKQLQTLLKNI
ncbi:MAG: glycosyltransferase family 4 protein, partial [Candidatus Magasanikbacteria bacterium]|nr:glycosyltransferase family 4 protein [Candidatus Magasanikbacteria bacterium]